MDFMTALSLVAEDTREQNGPDLTDTQAIDEARTCDRDDINAAVDEPELREAYHQVLDATDQEIRQALTRF